MKKQQGQTLLEVVIATSLLVLVLTVMVSAVATANANNRRSKERAVATRLAQSAQDWLRGERDSKGWGRFVSYFSGTQTFCIGDIDIEIMGMTLCTDAAADPNIPHSVTNYKTAYQRRLQTTLSDDDVTIPGDDTLTYTIEVTWASGRAIEEEVAIYGKITQWR